MESSHSLESRKFYIETVEVLVTGSGRSLVQDIIDGEEVKEVAFDRAHINPTMKKYYENLSKFQGLPSSNVGRV